MRQTLKTSMPTQLATTAAVILLAAAAATFFVDKTEANPASTTQQRHPCGDLPPITETLTARMMAAGQEFVLEGTAPSGRCTISATVTPLSEAQTSAAAQHPCTLSLHAEVGPSGTTAWLERSGSCGAFVSSTTVRVTGTGAAEASLYHGAATNSSGTSTARARIRITGFSPSGYLTSDVRGTWSHTSNSVSVVALTYPTNDSTPYLSSGTNTASTSYGVSPPSIEAENEIPWYGPLNDLRLETSVTLTMLAGGGYHCSHDHQAYDDTGNEDDITTLGAFAKVKGECFP